MIDERFYKDMDKFVEAIRDLKIEEFKTTNRIGAMQKINTDFAPSGEIPKLEITLDDLSVEKIFMRIKLSSNMTK